jgi:hypothetical protein
MSGDVYVRLGWPALNTAVSTQPVADGINIDFDHRGVPVGVEVLGAVDLEVDGVRVGLPSDED